MASLIGGCLSRDWSPCSPRGEEHSRQEREGSKVGLRAWFRNGKEARVWLACVGNGESGKISEVEEAGLCGVVWPILRICCGGNESLLRVLRI